MSNLRNSPQNKSKARKGSPIGGMALAAAGSWILYSHYGVNHNMPIADAIPAGRSSYYSKTAGRLNYYSDLQAEGRPLVLIHSVNAAASAYEMGPLFAHYRGKRPVYALDLPGFGFSERSERVYSADLFTNAITDFLASEVKEPADIVSLSLGGEFSSRAGLAHPALVHSQVLISPTGLNRLAGSSSSLAGQVYGVSNFIHLLLSFPLWSRPIFDAIATHSSIEFFLRKSFIGPISPGMVEYAYASAHQPGAEHAPLYFLAGKLFTQNARTVVYERLRTPSLVIYDRDAYSNFSALPDLLLKNSAWQAVRLVPSLGLPHFERLSDTVDVIDNFWKGLK
jgi:pimeloyl-ACP methyl ester carboxylesterase